VLLLTNSMAPYRLPVFNELARHCDLSVWFMREQLRRRAWPTYWDDIGFDFRVLPGRELRVRDRAVLVNTDAIHAAKDRDCVIVGGWDSLTAATAAAVCRARGVPYVLWSGSTALSTRNASGLAQRYRRAFVKGASAYVSYGHAAAEHLATLGAPREATTVGRNVGDTTFFAEAKQDRKEGGRVGVFVGELTPRLGADLLPALAEQAGLDEVLVAGSGPLADTLRESPRLTLLGQVDRAGVRDTLGRGNVFLAPFRVAPFSISVSEALAAGCPVVVSSVDGARDLVRPDESNGRIAAVEPLSAFARAVRGVLDTATPEAARDSVPADDYTTYANALLAAARHAVSREARP
jgi:glycosyltransferase involved in cell wall biosynthesis